VKTRCPVELQTSGTHGFKSRIQQTIAVNHRGILLGHLLMPQVYRAAAGICVVVTVLEGITPDGTKAAIRHTSNDSCGKRVFLKVYDYGRRSWVM
jgi:hypothetical protein